MRMYLDHLFWIRIGTVISVYRGLYWHEGIVYGHLPNGEPLIVSISTSGLLCETLTKFARSQTTVEISYPSQLPGWLVVRRGFRAARGRPYDYTDWNCQHVVRAAHGRKPESPIANGWLGAALMAAIAAGITAVAR